MNANQGYFCLIQYCPDRARMETVNVGVVLFCPALQLLEVRVTGRDQRAARLFGSDGLRTDSLPLAKEALVNRLRSDATRPQTLEELQHFVDSRGNALILTPPRSVRVEDPACQLDDLFRQLVLDPHPIGAGGTDNALANGEELLAASATIQSVETR